MTEHFDIAYIQKHGVSNLPLEKAAALTMVGITFGLGAVLVFTEVNVVATATFRVVASSKARPIQATQGGKIISAPFRSLQKVKAGDVVFQLDGQYTSSNITMQANEIRASELVSRRAKALSSLLANIQSAPLTAPFSDVSSSGGQFDDTVLNSAYEAMRDRIMALRIQYETLSHLESGLEAQYRQLSEVVASNQKRFEALLELANTGFLSKAELMREDENLRRQRRDLLDLQFRSRQTESNKQEVVANIRATISDAKKEIEQTGSDNALKLSNMGQALSKLNHLQKQESLAAPLAGTLQDVKYPGVGSIVGPGEVIAMIAPDDEVLEVVAEISSSDIGFIHLGQSAKIKLDTYPFEKYGSIPGTVVSLSNDSKLSPLYAWTFQAVIRPNHNTLVVDGEPHAMRIGETGKVDLILRKRRLIDFFLEPIFKYTSRAVQTQ